VCGCETGGGRRTEKERKREREKERKREREKERKRERENIVTYPSKLYFS
jgi:hypothetical protein